MKQKFSRPFGVLPQVALLGDEGAANHNRLGGRLRRTRACSFLFTGERQGNDTRPSRYPARQTREASEAVARLNQVNPQQVIFAQQNPDVIDQGVFHNDVIAVSNQPGAVLPSSRRSLDQPQLLATPARAGELVLWR